jgi:enamine deaminase RidA (YjgF/YER057c/UK114 family)
VSIRKRVSTSSPYEPTIGMSRALRVGPVIAVSGTAPIDSDGATVFHGDVYNQTKRCLDIALAVIVRAGGTPESVVRTRVMLVDIRHWRDAARAHGEVFANIQPACTFVEVSRFIDPDWLVEIEVDCYVI